jgi:hypothetical protein
MQYKLSKDIHIYIYVYIYSQVYEYIYTIAVYIKQASRFT